MGLETSIGIGLSFGALFGGLLAWLALRSPTAALNARLSLMEKELAAGTADFKRLQETHELLVASKARLESALESERKTSNEKIELVTQASEDLRNAFKAMASEALNTNNRAFLEIAQETLKRFQNDAYGDLKAQVQSLIITQKELHSQTGNLVKALRTPNVRGRWGEIQLRRVVEIAGMLSYCDFSEQETVTTDTGRIRPALIGNLPGGKKLVDDAKTPLQAFLDAFETTDEDARRACLASHARQVRDHIETLSDKRYWAQFESTPEFVVMFLPGETFFSAALEQDPGLIEHGVLNKVIPASPTTLIALLKAVAYGWNQEKLARNAHEISVLGKELHDRLRHLAGHITAVGTGLDRAVEAYNKAVGSLETRVLVSARKFTELGAPVAEDIPELESIETTARALSFDWDDEAPLLEAAEETPGKNERKAG